MFDRLIQISHKGGSRLSIEKDVERLLCLANGGLMKNNHVMSEMPELDTLKCGDYLVNVSAFFDDAEGKNKHRIMRVDAAQAVISALIDKDYVVAKCPHFSAAEIPDSLSVTLGKST